MPLDTILKPRTKCLGENMHQVALEQQHKSFLLVHNHLKHAKKRHSKYADRGATNISFSVGYLVYFKNHLRKNKVESKWRPYYRVIEQASPVTFVIRNQLDGVTTKVHAKHLRLAKKSWKIPRRPLRKK